ncbi:MAG: DNA oxidative demethylase AlkB [Novosphingobium sp.]
MQPDLFTDTHGRHMLDPGAVVLSGFALKEANALIGCIHTFCAASPFRQMETRGGHRMSVAMSNCGKLGWVSDRTGYRYDAVDPYTGRPWPAMPPLFADLATRAAQAAGFAFYAPDACLINRYIPGTKLSLHQDMDERDQLAPIVSVSLGLPAIFLWGGKTRGSPKQRIDLHHGDVTVWGGPSRMVFHGVAPLKDGQHQATGRLRYNLTFRKAA